MDVTEINDEAGHGIGEPSAESQDAVGDARSEIARDVAALVEAHPVGTLLGALGVGYVLGGGVFTAMTRRLLSAGLRLGFQLAVLPAVEGELAGLARDLGKSSGRAAENAAPSARL